MKHNQDLIEVFEDTKKIVESGKINLNSITTKHKVSEIRFIPNQVIVPNLDTVNLDTVSAARHYSKLGKTCILNMASAKRAGGGVANGARAQEECLFRCSNLYQTVDQSFYPLSIDEGLYTKDAIFFKDKSYKKIKPFSVDVVTVPALNLNTKYGILNLITEYDEITKNKIRLMFYLAKKNDCKNIILGAWGCGVFKNKPEDIAELFQDVLYEKQGKGATCYLNSFENIIFAVINDHNSVSNNFDVFLQHF